MLTRPESRYVLLDELAAGPHASVYRGMDRADGSDVVVKIFADSRADQILTEARAAVRLQHPNIRGPKDLLLLDRPWLILDHVTGESLQDLLDRQDCVDVSVACFWTWQLLDGLMALWRTGLVHHDVKPANIVIRDGLTPVLVDLGSCLALDSSAPPISTPAFTAPELLRGEAASPASDLYSLALCLFWMVAGRHPFAEHHGSSQAMLAAHRDEHPAELRSCRPGVPRGLSRRVARCLHKEPTARPTAVALRRTLEAACR